MKDKTILATITIIVLGLLEGIALFRGIDGAMLATMLMVIAGVGTGTFSYVAGKKKGVR